MSIETSEVLELPASSAQKRLWLLDRLDPGSSAYNVPTTTRLAGHLDVGALTRAISEVVTRHEVLRTTFAVRGGEPVQLIHPPAQMLLPVTDLSELDPAEAEAEARRLAGTYARLPFDLTRGPLLRARLLRLKEEEHVLLLVAHHVVTDGWSTGVLFSELAALYAAYRSGGESPLEELPIQYADYAAWQEERLQGEELRGQLDYWRGKLSGAAGALELPADRPRPARPSGRGGQRSAGLGSEVSAGLRELGRSEGATLFMTLLAAFQAFLYRYTGQGDVSVGTPIANRGQAEVQGLIGFFVNTLVLREEVSGGEGFRGLLRRVRGGCVSAYANQEVPFDRVVEELQPERDLHRPPFFNVMIDLDASSPEPLKLPGLTLTQRWSFNDTAKFDLLLVCKEMDGEMFLLFEYSTDLYEHETVERMLEHFRIFLRGIVARPDQPIDELPLLSQEERADLFANRCEAASLLASHPAVLDAVVLRRGESSWADADTAFVVKRRGAEVTREQLQDYLGEQLPDASVAPWVVLTEMIPASPAGKVNARALRKLAGYFEQTAQAANASPATLEGKSAELSARRARLSEGKQRLLEKRLQMVRKTA